MLLRVRLSDLIVPDEAAYEDFPLWAKLKARLVEQEVEMYLADPASSNRHWADTALINHTVLLPRGATEILHDRNVPADALMHTAWHHAGVEAMGALSSSAEGLLLGESVASAFDAFVVGTLLRTESEHPSALDTQVPAMAEAAAAGGGSPEDFEALLHRMAEDPEGSFEELRELLFDVSMGLLRADGVDAADEVLSNVHGHVFAPILHHYDLSIWVLYARAFGKDLKAHASLRKIDVALREESHPLAWLESHWLDRGRSSA